MNKSKIEWTDYTWNPVVGCLHRCEYCYARRINSRFEDGKFTPTLKVGKLKEPLRAKRPAKIFVASMADLFGDWEWKDGSPYSDAMYHRNEVVSLILDIVKQCPQHTVIFLTKNPKGMQGYQFPDNCWCGTSVENQEKADERIPELLKVDCKTKFVSVEPILGPIDLHVHEVDTTCRCYGCLKTAKENPTSWMAQRIDWVIVGAQTGPGAVTPNFNWINNIVHQCKLDHVPVFVKDNCKWPEAIREFPKEAQA